MPRINDHRPLPSTTVSSSSEAPAENVTRTTRPSGELSLRYEADLARLLDLGRGPTTSDGDADGVSALDLRRSSAADAEVINEALEAGLTTRRSRGPEGREKVITRTAHDRLRALLADGPAGLRQRLAADLHAIGGPAKGLGRALYLKAVAARVAALRGDAERRDTALATLAAFARRVSGSSEDDLLARATVLDLDSGRDTASFEPLIYDRTVGTIHLPTAEARADNDGLLQRFTGSCGPTTMQMAWCEADPVRAFIVHDQGLAALDVDDDSGDLQRGLLAEVSSAAISRRAHWNRCRLRNGLGRLRATGKINRAESRALRLWAEDRAAASAAGRAALAALRQLAEGFPSDSELEEMRVEPQKGTTGMDCDEFAAMLNTNLSPATGCRYRQSEPSEGIEPGRLGPFLDTVARALRRGHDVPFGVYEAEHWMLLTAVRGSGDGRQFLVSDPYSGRTAWVPRADLVSGSFVAEAFELLGSGEMDHIDALFLPEEP